MNHLLSSLLFWGFYLPFVVFLLTFKRWACAFALLACGGCVAYPQYCVDAQGRPIGYAVYSYEHHMPQVVQPQPKTYPFTGQYVPEYREPVPGLQPDLLAPSPFPESPFFGGPSSTNPADGSTLTPFFGPNNSLLCTEHNGLTVCQ